MLKLKTDLRVKSRLVLKCAAHPRYNPEKDGPGGIRGGCKFCTDILTAYEARQHLFSAARQYEMKSRAYENRKAPANAERNDKSKGTPQV